MKWCLKKIKKTHFILLGVITLSIVFLLIPFFAEGPDETSPGEENNFFGININSDDPLPNDKFYTDLEGEVDFETEDYEDEELDIEESEYAVYISGEVKIPGVYYLDPGSRVYEVIKEAGGALDSARLDHINLAAKIVDGEHIHIPSKDDELQDFEKNIVWNEKTRVNENEDGLININKASSAELEELPSIGPARAGNIVDYRENNGYFNDIRDIENVPGIGTGIYEQIKTKITI